VQPLGLRVQILVGLGVVTGFAMLSTGYLALWAAGESVVSQREAAARTVAAGVAGAASAVVDGRLPLGDAQNRRQLQTALKAMGEGQGDIGGLEVFGADRRLVLARPPVAEGDVDRPLLAGVLAGVGPALHYRRRPGDGITELGAYAPIVSGNRVMGVVRVSLDAPEPLATVLGRSTFMLLVLAAIDALLVVGLGFFVLTHLVVRPLQVMQTATSRVSAGDWEQRIDTSGPREVAALASALNRMTASLASQRDQLIRTEKLASVGQLAAGVAHEIGNPLAAVLGYADILRADAAGEGGALTAMERQDALSRVKAETQRIHRIIQDLLAYSRPTTDEPMAVDPGKILHSALALLAPQARFRGVQVQASGEPWPEVLASAGRLTQVFVNLLLNAADAMEGKGQVQVTGIFAAGRVRLSFRDHGPGVPAELAGKIFDPFFTTKAPGQGTGLGLSISRSIVEAYHGALELDPAPEGGGAAFVVILPAAGPPQGV
jgi:two-component system, NtrC family, sensor kinase